MKSGGGLEDVPIEQEDVAIISIYISIHNGSKAVVTKKNH